MSTISEKQITEVENTLSQLSPGFLPYPIFLQVSRLTVNCIIEIVPIRLRDNKPEVLLLKREESCSIWSNMFHTPGTVLRATDEKWSFVSAFDRVIKTELKEYKISSSPIYVDTVFQQTARGAELALVHYVEVEDNFNNDNFYSLNRLPDNVVETQINFIKNAVNRFLMANNLSPLAKHLKDII